MKYIIRPDVLQSKAAIDLTQLGGKAKALAALGQKFFIPDWIVVLPAAFAVSLPEIDRSSPEALLAELEQIKLDGSITAELSEALAELCPNGELLAVRSSALDEDGATHSFAGQLESFLNVPVDQVAEKVVEVWRSGFSDRMLAYRKEHQLAPLPQPPAVLIQRMVKAEFAGVAFSANPITGQRGVAVVSAVRGLGDALVSGASDADTYEIDRTGKILTRQTLEAEPLLSDQQIQSIATLARQTAQFFHCPQDIEWAIESGQLYLLQSRPITTLSQLPDPDGFLNLWDNSNIAESYGGITTPLTFSFARRAYEAVYRQFCRLMGVPEKTIAQQATTFRQMLGLLRGRIYYNLLNWYRVLALLPGFTVNRRFMEQMMGVKEELSAEVTVEVMNASLGDKLQDSLRLAQTLLGLVRNYLTLSHQIREFYQRLDRALALPLSQLEDMRSDELTAYYHDLEHQLLTRWDAPLVNDFFAMIFYGVLRKLTVKWCDDKDGTLQNDLISGEGGMISAEPAQRMIEMAATIAPNPEMITLLCEGSLPQIQSHIAKIPQFHAQYQAYLDKFGDRCLEELKLESATLQDDPLLLLRSVGQLARNGKPEAQRPKPEINLRQQAEERVRQSLQKYPMRRVLFDWVLQNARARVRDRENLRFERTRVFGRVRRIMVELGKRFYAADLLKHPRDIFYLELDEILGTIDGTTTCTQLNEFVAIRQAEFESYRQLPAPPDRFSTRGTVHPLADIIPAQSPTPSISDQSLQGMGCCPGIVRAPVQVITDPKNAVLQQGRILVAERTDPGWIMLFPSASGVLVERGSLLSHSAIVSREMGIPSIVSIPGITQWLKDGDWVEMNGSTGIVQRIEPPFSELPPDQIVQSL